MSRNARKVELDGIAQMATSLDPVYVSELSAERVSVFQSENSDDYKASQGVMAS